MLHEFLYDLRYILIQVLKFHTVTKGSYKTKRQKKSEAYILIYEQNHGGPF